MFDVSNYTILELAELRSEIDECTRTKKLALRQAFNDKVLANSKGKSMTFVEGDASFVVTGEDFNATCVMLNTSVFSVETITFKTPKSEGMRVALSNLFNLGVNGLEVF